MTVSVFTGRRLRRAARQIFGWDRLRPGQLTAMKAVMAGRDTVAMMPTGAGKSAVYQVPSVLLPGPTLVVSPLIALQRDQVAGLLRQGGRSAVAINSSMSDRHNEEAWESVSGGGVRVLFVTPEQLAKPDVLERLAALAPSLFVVDEAHCVSSWGHDFRPDYLRLRQAAESIGRPPILALTAGAAGPVRADIIERLGMRRVRQVVAGFDRPNIHLEVTHFLDDAAKRRAVVERAAAEPKPGIVYAATRKDAERYAAELDELGLDAAAYHAGLRTADRSSVHDRFLAGELDVVVATSAFGMGIDKPDVRFVLHASIPGSLDAYYQEIGRAGRDGAAARAVLHYRTQDLGLRKFFSSGRPDPDTVLDVARRVHAHDGPMEAAELQGQTGLSATRLTAVLNLLEQAGAVSTSTGMVDAVPGHEPRQAAREAMEIATAHESLERSRVDMMRGLAETTGCRRRFLLGYFGERVPTPCGNCDRCEAQPDAPARRGGAAGDRNGDRNGDRAGGRSGGRDRSRTGRGAGRGAGGRAGSPDGSRSAQVPGPAPDPGSAPSTRGGHPFPPGTRVTHPRWGTGEVLSEEAERITVLFDSVGYRTLSLPLVMDKALLAPAPR